MSIQDYYDRTTPDDGFRKVMYRAKKGLQSAELNETQSIIMREINTRFEALYKEGSLIRGGAISIQGNLALLDEAVTVTRGFTTDVPQNTLTFTPTGTYVIGIASLSETITEADIVGLLDPAVGTKNYQQPGAARQKITGRWALETDALLTEFFYPIYVIIDGTLVDGNVKANEQLETFNSALARYDAGANGNYVVDGLSPSFEYDDVANGKYIVTIGQGIGHVNGYELKFDYDKSISIPYPLDIKNVVGEPFTYNDGVTDYYLRHNPGAAIEEVLGTFESSDTVTHGNFSGASDVMPNTPVVSVLSVVQGATTYVEGVDFIIAGDSLDWSLPGAEPAPGSSYDVVYRYQGNHAVTLSADRKYIEVTGLADGTLFYVDYDYYIPRIDRIILVQSGELVLLKGTPDEYTPVAPDHSEGLSLATVSLVFGTAPRVIADTLRSFKMQDIQEINERLSGMETNIARLALLEDGRSSDPSTVKKGLFVDPFFDDDQRDLGQTQNAIIMDEALLPGINWDQTTISEDEDGVFLPHSEVIEINQTASTGTRKVNEFAWLAPKPAKIRVSPARYQWINRTVYRTIWASQSWRWIPQWTRTWVNRSTITTLARSTRVLVDNTGTSSSTSTDNTRVDIPQINLTVSGDNFNANENCVIEYDGREVATVAANGSGVLSGSFQIPSGSKSGSKRVTVVGQESGVQGETVFFAQGLVRTTTRRRRRISFDPVAQTFTPSKTHYITSLDLVFSAAPVGSDVTVFVVETVVGIPDRNAVIGQTELGEGDITVNTWTKFSFNKPIKLTGGVEYAVVVATTDTTSAVKIAKLGRYDSANKRWVSKQAFEGGVFLNSSNASTWSPIQDEDLTVRMYKAAFSPTETRVIGSVAATAATDLMLLSTMDLSPGTSAEFRGILTDRSNEEVILIPHAPTIISEYTGNVDIEMTISTNDPNISPELSEVIQLAMGVVDLPSTYITRQFPVDGDTLKVLMEVNEPSGASITVDYWDGDSWEPLTKDALSGIPVGDGFVDMPYEVTGLAIANTNLRVTLDSADKTRRPYARRLRALIS